VLDVTFVVGNAMRLDLADDAVDGVVSRHLLWTLPDPPGALREWARVTRPGGTVAVLDGLWLDPSWNARLRGRIAAPLRRIFAPPSHADASYAELVSRLPLSGGATPQQAEALLRAAGLRDVTVRDLDSLRRAERAARPWYDRIAAPRVTWLARGTVTS
jgi:ubiquinone/menaquinone biosynthesis C-methylase UbiE